jgi:hypothetical protein
MPRSIMVEIVSHFEFAHAIHRRADYAPGPNGDNSGVCCPPKCATGVPGRLRISLGERLCAL